MKKSIKHILILSFTIALMLGVVWVQFAGADKSTEGEQYRERLKTFFNSNHLSYDYEASFDLEDTAGIVSKGRIIKSGPDYVDSNGQYYRILSGNTFLNVDLAMQSVFVVDINKMEQDMGFRREDLNAGLFDVADSNYAALGTWKVLDRKPDATRVEFAVRDTTEQMIRKVEFVFNESTITNMEVHFSRAEALQNGNGVKNLVVRMNNFNRDSVDLSRSIAEVVRLENRAAPILVGKFKNYQLKQL